MVSWWRWQVQGRRGALGGAWGRPAPHLCSDQWALRCWDSCPPPASFWRPRLGQVLPTAGTAARGPLWAPVCVWGLQVGVCRPSLLPAFGAPRFHRRGSLPKSLAGCPLWGFLLSPHLSRSPQPVRDVGQRP